MSLRRRVSQLERSAARLVADLEADLAAGRRSFVELTTAEMNMLMADLTPAERAWLESLSFAELTQAAAGELVYPNRGE